MLKKTKVEVKSEKALYAAKKIKDFSTLKHFEKCRA